MSAPTILLGHQRPRYLSLPPSVNSAGPEATDLAARAGLFLDPWQSLILDAAMGLRADGAWTAFETAIVVPRQNGKGSILEARELAGLFMFGEELIIHTAHEFKTAQEAFLRIKWLVENTDEFSKRVANIRTSHGSEGIELRPKETIVTGSSSRRVRIGKASRLRFVARTTAGSGRGFSGNVVILDEAFNLPNQVMSALMFTMSARENPQLWYASSAVNKDEHPNGDVLAAVRDRGLAGDDSSLVYAEWCADETAYKENPREVASDPEQWAAANPGLGIRIAAEHVARERNSMGAESKSFAVERLGIGDWPTLAGGMQVIDPAVWASLVDSDSSIDGAVVFAADATQGRTAGSIAAAGRRADGLLHGEIVDNRPGTNWMLNRLIELNQSWAPQSVILDPSSAAGSLISGLEAAGITVVEVSGRAMAQACGWTHDLITSSGVRHRGQPELAAALAAAKKRSMGDSWVWDRKDSAGDISPLGAFTLALHGFSQPAEAPQPFFAAWS